jgi:ribokinase
VSRIAVVGGINMDLHLFGGRRWSSGAALVVDHYFTEPGGKGGNVARAAARLGADVRLVARVGDDEFGHQCVEAIAKDGVDVSAVTYSTTTPTGFVAIELNEGLHRTLVFAPGANDELTWEHVEPTMDELGTGEIVIAQAEIPGPVMQSLARNVSSNGTRLYLDPTPPEDVDGAAMRAADVITPDRAEAAALVGRADTSELWPALAAGELHDAGARTVVVKTGATGAVLVDGWGSRQIPTPAIEPVDETGAGDVFMAALAVRRAEGAGWDDAVRFANAASALSVASQGLLLPDRDTVEETFAEMG